MTSNRRGFTLVEVVVSLLIAGIIGAAFMRLLMAQNRYFTHETNLRGARSIARSATNVLMSDLRMVQDSGGVDSVTADGKLMRILVPYRFGLVCGTGANITTVSMLPTDSGTIAVSVYRGFAWRDSTTGRYHYLWPANPTGSDIPAAASNPAVCTGNGAGQAQIRTVSANGRTGDILDLKTSGGSGAAANTPVFFWQHITYSFRASGVYPGKMALWRNVEGGRNEELMAPFDTAAGFQFYKSGTDVPQAAPPPVAEIRGVNLVLTAVSPSAIASDSTPSQSRVVTSVFFKNVRAF
jgi:prepilin-type N-terminal cleavage/methylation domain-containing protein